MNDFFMASIAIFAHGRHLFLIRHFGLVMHLLPSKCIVSPIQC